MVTGGGESGKGSGRGDGRELGECRCVRKKLSHDLKTAVCTHKDHMTCYYPMPCPHFEIQDVSVGRMIQREKKYKKICKYRNIYILSLIMVYMLSEKKMQAKKILSAKRPV